MKKVLIVFLFFLFITFISGAFFCMSYRNNHNPESILSRIEGMDNMSPSPSSSSECPDMLIRSGDALLLYNSKKPEEAGKNPMPFFTIDDYIAYLDTQKKKNGGKPACPVLYLQEEVNTQGENVFRVRPGPFDQGAGLPQTSMLFKEHEKVMPVLDASRENKNYNQNEYAGFDPYGQQIGQYTDLDKIHDSTMVGNKISDNPMDLNWGGVIYTHDAVASGKYKENEIQPSNEHTMFLLPNDSLRNQSHIKNINA